MIYFLTLLKAFLNRKASRPKWAMTVPDIPWFIFNCLFGILIEEIKMAMECIKPTINIIKLRKDNKYPDYKTLESKEKVIAQEFIVIKERADGFKIKLIHLESAVQLVFYLTLLLVSLNEKPLMDLNYNETIPKLASIKWVGGLIFFLFKTFLSGYTTFSSILRGLKKDAYRLTGSAPSLLQFACVVISVLLDIIFSSFVTFLGWSYLI